MTESTSFTDVELQLLDSESNMGYPDRELPCPLDASISRLVDSFIAAAKEERERMASQITDEHSFTLLVFGERMASLAVRQRSPASLKRALAALALEEGRWDPREDMLVLSLIYNAAVKLGLDAASLFEEAAGLALPRMATYFRAFPARSDEEKSIEAMGYRESSTPDGFVYERTW